MGLRIEFVLIFLIGGIISGSLLLKLSNRDIETKKLLKELEFTHTTFTEVDTNKMQGHAYGVYGVRSQGVLTLDQLTYHTENIEFLVANRGRYEGDILYLDGAVTLKEKDGYTYKTEHAVYDQKKELLNITAAFTGQKDKNLIKGSSLEYDIRLKKAYGTTIESVLYTVEK